MLLDTHILLLWMGDPKRLSRTQLRAIEGAVSRHEGLGISAMTLLEIAMLEREQKIDLKGTIDDLFAEMQSSLELQLLPLTYEIALQAGSLISLRDPADRVIAATAMVLRLWLVTSDQRIIASRLVGTIE
jgi:PIN domain nuclease of toxin-antitoxin system